MSGTNGLAGHARLLRRLEATYLKLVDPPPALPRPVLSVWVHEYGQRVAVNPHTGATCPVDGLAPGPAPGLTLVVEIVPDREL